MRAFGKHPDLAALQAAAGLAVARCSTRSVQRNARGCAASVRCQVTRGISGPWREGEAYRARLVPPLEVPQAPAALLVAYAKDGSTWRLEKFWPATIDRLMAAAYAKQVALPRPPPRS